jgi:Small-conductance mechanosensitive channel
VVLLNRILYLIARVSDMRVETVCLLLKNALKYICVVVFVYYGLAQFGVDTRTLLASAGILSLMISFGAKDLVSDIIAGFFTLVEGSYKVGDFITVGSWYGTVTEIGLRTTKVSFFADTKIFNNSSLRDIVNSDGKVARMVLEAPISYNADLTEVEAILAEELPKMTDRIPGLVKPPRYENVQSLGDSAVNLRIAIYVQSDLRYVALRALNREVKLMFDRRGIEIPFNQIVVHHEQETAGNNETPII